MMRGRMSQSVSLLSSRRGFAAVGGGVSDYAPDSLHLRRFTLLA